MRTFDRRTDTIAGPSPRDDGIRILQVSKSCAAWQVDSDEDLIDTGRCRRTKLCKVAGFRLKPSADRAMLSQPAEDDYRS